MAESGPESNLSDFSEDEDRELIDKENQSLGLDTENRFRPSSHDTNEEDGDRQIFEQQQFQRQQFYSQQRHSQQPDHPVHPYGSTSSPEFDGDHNDEDDVDDNTPSPMELNESRPMTKKSAAVGASSSDSDSSSSESDIGNLADDQFDDSNLEPSLSNDISIETVPLEEERSDIQSPTRLRSSLSINPIGSIDATSTNASESQEPMQYTPEPVPEYLVDRIDQEKWPGVNGDYDNEGQWREWQELTTAVNMYSGDIVNILPYVNISC